MSARLPTFLTIQRGRRLTGALGWLALAMVGATVGLGLALPFTIEQKEYSRLLAIHPAVAWTGYLAVGVAALAGIAWLVTRNDRWDLLGAASLEVGALFTALMLVTGSVWGRPVWGTWWEWDARLTSAAVLMAMLVGILALRSAIESPRARAMVTAIYAIALVPEIALVHFSVDLWQTLHQGRSLATPAPGLNLDSIFFAVMLLSFFAFSVTYAWMTRVRAEILAGQEAADAARLAQAVRERRAAPPGVGPAGPTGSPSPEARP